MTGDLAALAALFVVSFSYVAASFDVSTRNLDRIKDLDGQTEAMSDRQSPHFVAPDLFRSFYPTSSSHRKMEETQRKPKYECGHVIQTLDPGFASGLMNTLASDPNLASVFVPLLPLVQYGVEVRKICASCAEYRSKSSSDEFLEYCGKSVYGSKSFFSGLLMLPLVMSGGELVIKPETTPGFIYAHPTETENLDDIPSEIDFPAEIPITAIMGFVAAVTGHIAIMPDFMGYGETGDELSKGYIIKKAYQTSTVPLWLKARSIVSEETECASALADATVVVGYSEGGYASVAIADALYHGLNTDIITLFSGGGPYDLVYTLQKIVQSDLDGSFRLGFIHVLALVGSAYSTTYEDVANYKKKQDLLSAQNKCDLNELVWTGFEIKDLVEDPYYRADPLGRMWDQDFLHLLRSAVDEGERYACSPDRTTDGVDDKICEALTDADLTSILTQAASAYTVMLCHSPADELIDFGNVPEALNGSLLSGPLLDPSLDHSDYGVRCVATALALIPQYDMYEVVPRHSDHGCDTSGDRSKGKSKGSKKKKTTKKKKGKMPKCKAYDD